MKVVPWATLGAALALLISTIAMAEHWREGGWEIPSAMFFGIPIAACILSFVAYLQGRHLQAKAGLAVVLVVAGVTMVLLRDRYYGDYSALRGRVAPDGSRVTSVSWTESGGRYVETINGRFKIELSEAQYREKMREHQAPFLAGFVGVTTIAVSMSILNIVVARRRRWGGVA
jgi:uncharacterized membrane protein YfcA